MDYSLDTTPLDSLSCDCLILGVYQDQQLSASAKTLNESTQELLKKILARGDIAGKNGETLLINAVPSNSIARILLVGLGENKPLTTKNYRKAILASINSLKKSSIGTVVCNLSDCVVSGMDSAWKTEKKFTVFLTAQLLHD